MAIKIVGCILFGLVAAVLVVGGATAGVLKGTELARRRRTRHAGHSMSSDTRLALAGACCLAVLVVVFFGLWNAIEVAGR